jgi:hypothetical protein
MTMTMTTTTNGLDGLAGKMVAMGGRSDGVGNDAQHPCL